MALTTTACTECSHPAHEGACPVCTDEAQLGQYAPCQDAGARAVQVQPERARRRAAISAGEPFRYDVVGYGPTAERALADAQAWQASNGSGGAGSALYGPTVPVVWGTPYAPEAAGHGYSKWQVPVWWVVATHQPQPVAVEGLLAGDLVYLQDRPGGQPDEVVRLTSAAAGRATGYRGIDDPRIEVSAYGRVIGQSDALASARHLSWPAGTLVQAARP